MDNSAPPGRVRLQIGINVNNIISNQNRDTSPVIGFRIRVLGYIGFRRGVTGVSPVPKKDFKEFVFFIAPAT